MDIYSSQQRSEIMRSIRGTDTKPEMTVRRLVYSLGYRYRLHSKDLPGKPDLSFRSRKKALFVHGCFWHRHNCTKGRSMPQTNVAAWDRKFTRTMQRDARIRNELAAIQFDSVVIWECEIRRGSMDMLAKRIKDYLK